MSSYDKFCWTQELEALWARREDENDLLKMYYQMEIEINFNNFEEITG